MADNKNTWLNEISSSQTQFYLDEANDFLIERDTTRDILVQLFDLQFPKKTY